MSDTSVTVIEPADDDPPRTPDTVAETAVAAIGETSRAAADAGANATRASDAAYTASDAETRAREHADAAARSEAAIGSMMGGLMEAVSNIPVKIGETLQSLVTNTPASQPTVETTESELPKKVVKPNTHWMNKKISLFGRGDK